MYTFTDSLRSDAGEIYCRDKMYIRRVDFEVFFIAVFIAYAVIEVGVRGGDLKRGIFYKALRSAGGEEMISLCVQKARAMEASFTLPTP